MGWPVSVPWRSVFVLWPVLVVFVSYELVINSNLFFGIAAIGYRDPPDRDWPFLVGRWPLTPGSHPGSSRASGVGLDLGPGPWAF